jgi:hypothetical protein
VPGQSELAHDEHVERSVQPSRHFIRDGNTPARQAKDNDVVPSGIAPHPIDENPARFAAICIPDSPGGEDAHALCECNHDTGVYASADATGALSR